MWYTLLSEEGIVGIIYNYAIFLALGLALSKTAFKDKKYAVLVISLLFYLLFNHTVGSVFVVLPGKSITINCIAPVILMCLYFYSKSQKTSLEFYKKNYKEHV